MRFIIFLMFILLTSCSMNKKIVYLLLSGFMKIKKNLKSFDSHMFGTFKVKFLKKKFNKKKEINLVSINLNKDTNNNELKIKTKYIKKKNSLFKLSKLNKEKTVTDTKKKDTFFKIPKVNKDKKVNKFETGDAVICRKKI